MRQFYSSFTPAFKLVGIFTKLALAWMFIGGSAWAEQTPFMLGDLVAEPGTKVSGYLAVDPDDPANDLPVTIINGVTEGPTLALIAGVHGSEYAPILALQKLRAWSNPEVLAGRVIMVHLANPESFFDRTIYYHPGDGQNLNRQFPGSAEGTITSKIAQVLTSEVIDRADYLIDLHAGDGNEQLSPYTYMLITGDEILDAQIRKMAIAFGIKTILKTDVRDDDRDNPKYTDVTAAFRGVPAITTETGQLGQTREEQINLAFNGVARVMAMLRMGNAVGPCPLQNGSYDVDCGSLVRSGEREPYPEDAYTDIRWLSGYEVLTAPFTGVFTPLADAGTVVVKGAVLGTFSDVFGDELGEVIAPYDGWINYIVATPPITKGEPVVMISRIEPGVDE